METDEAARQLESDKRNSVSKIEKAYINKKERSDARLIVEQKKIEKS
jgi:hypothetical protein